MIPVAMMRDENEIKDRAGVTLSPMGMALKALGNAAIDACLQAVIIRFTDESANSWGYAFKQVDYLGAAWEGVSSLLPWKTSPVVKKLSIAFVKAITIVIDKAVKNGAYTANDGLNDFIWAFGQSIFSQILGDQIVTKGELVYKGLTRFVKYNNNWLTNRIAGRCFSGFLMKYGCFTENTTVFINNNASTKIKDVKLNDRLISYKIKESFDGINSLLSTDNDLIRSEIKSSEEFQVDFHSLDNMHECTLLLTSEDLKKHQISKINDVVWLSIVDQGVEGSNIVTKIEHCRNNLTPASEISDPDFVYSRVTGIFAHNSNDVWKLTFDNGEELEVTSAHPFLRDGSDEWVAVLALSAGDKVRTESGAATLISKVLLPGFHKVYNLSVENTKTFLVGENGFVVHNTCAQLDDLANRFINNFSKELKKLEIENWWAKGYPGFFLRGTFFERLMAKGPRYTGWTLTAHNYPVIDFYKLVGNKVSVVSMKTTITKNVNDWISTNASHLSKLNNMQNRLVNKGTSEIRELHIYVKDIELNSFSNWASAIKQKYPNIKNVVISSIEKEFNL
jgi:hypothetical protein